MDGTMVQLQKAIVARLRATPAVTALCPSANIFDRSMRPEVPISIVLGEDQVVFEGITWTENHISIFTTLHLWQSTRLRDAEEPCRRDPIGNAPEANSNRRKHRADGLFRCAVPA
jgi:hypothetical protein